MAVFQFTDGNEIIKYDAPTEADAVAALREEIGTNRLNSFRRDYDPAMASKDVGAMEMIAPRTTTEGAGLKQTASDIITAPARAAYGAIRGGIDAAKSFGDIYYEQGKKGEFSPVNAASDVAQSYKKGFELGMAGRHPEGGIGQELAKDPTTTIGAVASGGAGVGATMARTFGRQAAAGAGSEFAGQTLEDKPYSPIGIIGAGLIGGVSATGASVLGTGKLTEKVARIGEAQSGASMESLMRASTREGREALKAAAGSERDLAKDLVKTVTDWESYSKEWSGQIKPALDGMNDVNIAPALGNLQNRIDMLKQRAGSIPDPSGATESSIKELESIMDRMRMGSSGMPKTRFSANEVYQIRQLADMDLDYSQMPTGGAIGKEVNSALKQLSSDLRESLKQSAIESGKPEYITAMQTLAQKLDAKERLLQKIGKNTLTQEDRATGIIRNAESQARPSQGELLRDIDDLFDKQYAQVAKDAIYARDLSNPEARTITGEPSFSPVAPTGRSAKSKVPLFGPIIDVGKSPAAFSLGYIPTARAVETVIDRTATQVPLRIGAGIIGGQTGSRLFGGR